MLVVMAPPQEEIQAVCEHIEQLGFRAHPLPESASAPPIASPAIRAKWIAAISKRSPGSRK